MPCKIKTNRLKFFGHTSAKPVQLPFQQVRNSEIIGAVTTQKKRFSKPNLTTGRTSAGLTTVIKVIRLQRLDESMR